MLAARVRVDVPLEMDAVRAAVVVVIVVLGVCGRSKGSAEQCFCIIQDAGEDVRTEPVIGTGRLFGQTGDAEQEGTVVIEKLGQAHGASLVYWADCQSWCLAVLWRSAKIDG